MKRIGKLDHRIEIEEYSETFGDFNEPILGYSTYATVWAERMETKLASGKEDEENNKLTGKRVQDWKIRYQSGINIKMRVKYDNRYYNILGIDILGRKESIILHTEETI